MDETVTNVPTRALIRKHPARAAWAVPLAIFLGVWERLSHWAFYGQPKWLAKIRLDVNLQKQQALLTGYRHLSPLALGMAKAKLEELRDQASMLRGRLSPSEAEDVVARARC
jgi:hypothetical protein